LKFKLNLCCALVFAASLLVAAQAHAQQISAASAQGSISLADDCTEIDIAYEHDELLTPEERLARMDDAFFESLNKFDSCQTSQLGASASASAASGGGGANGDGSSGTDGGNIGSGSALTSPDLTGTDPPTDNEFPQSDGKTGGAVAIAVEQGVASSVTGVNQPGNGKLPDDIPPADNDSVLEAQIRQAAMSETDPTARKKLWNEYRKYKGLSQPGH